MRLSRCGGWAFLICVVCLGGRKVARGRASKRFQSPLSGGGSLVPCHPMIISNELFRQIYIQVYMPGR